MKLSRLMHQVMDYTWLCVVTPYGEEHCFCNADYIGENPDVMPLLKPLLNRDIYAVDVVIRKDPYKRDVFNAEEVPMIYVTLKKTKKEMARDRHEIESRVNRPLSRSNKKSKNKVREEDRRKDEA